MAFRSDDRSWRRRRRHAAWSVVAMCAAVLVLPAPAPAGNGGTGSGGPGPAGKAKLAPNGDAIPPRSAPPRIIGAINAANRINRKPYIWGGGHLKWHSRGYDCSGAVSYVLHAGGFLAHPKDSTALEEWGRGGRGSWITVYANAGHAYAMIAGLRWDTAGDARGTGPRWHLDRVSHAGFTVRHPVGY